MSAADTPRFRALSRSIATRTSGWLNFRSASTKENTSLLRASSRNGSSASCSFPMSAAWMTSWAERPAPRRSPTEASCTTTVRAPGRLRTTRWRRAASSCCETSRFSLSFKNTRTKPALAAPEFPPPPEGACDMTMRASSPTSSSTTRLSSSM